MELDELKKSWNALDAQLQKALSYPALRMKEAV